MVTIADTNKVTTTIDAALADSDTSMWGWVAIAGGATTGRPTHDIDLILYPSATAKNGEAILAAHELIAQTQERLGSEIYLTPFSKLITLPHFASHAQAARPGDKNVPLHTLLFNSKQGYELDNPSGFRKSVEVSAITLHGDSSAIDLRSCLDRKEEEAYRLIHELCLGPNIGILPSKVIEEGRRILSTYMSKHYGVSVSPRANILEMEKALYEQLDERVA